VAMTTVSVAQKNFRVGAGFDKLVSVFRRPQHKRNPTGRDVSQPVLEHLEEETFVVGLESDGAAWLRGNRMVARIQPSRPLGLVRADWGLWALLCTRTHARSRVAHRSRGARR
jgi:hypothetical protein